MPFSEARDRLVAFGVSGDKAEPFWLAVRGNLDTLADAVDWWRILRPGRSGAGPLREGPRLLREAFDLLPPEPWDREPGRTGPTRQGGRPAARARRCSAAPAGAHRTSFRAGACRSIAACWVGKEHWPDDPEMMRPQPHAFQGLAAFFGLAPERNRRGPKPPFRTFECTESRKTPGKVPRTFRATRPAGRFPDIGLPCHDNGRRGERTSARRTRRRRLERLASFLNGGRRLLALPAPAFPAIAGNVAGHVG